MWQWIKNLFSSVADTRPDPEDPAAYDHLKLIQAEFESTGEVYQILRGGGKPSDVSKATAVVARPAMPFWVDVYEGPKGKGYVVNYEIVKDGKTLRKAINFGPEEWRERDWAEVVDGPR